MSFFILCFAITSTEYDISIDKRTLNIYPDETSKNITKEGVSSNSSSVLLEYVIVHPGITEICESSFLDYIKLISIDLPEKLEYLHDSCFSGCTALKSVVFPKGLLGISNMVFFNCISLENVTFSSTIQSIGTDHLFYKCGSLSHFIFSAENLKYSTDSEGKVLIENGTIAISGTAVFGTVKIPDEITILNRYFLNNFKNVTTIEFSSKEKLKRIEKQALRYTSITSIKYPEGLEYVGDIVLEGCTIDYIWVPSTLKSHDGIFATVPKSVGIHNDCKCLKFGADGNVYNENNTEIALFLNGVSSVVIGKDISKVNIQSITACKTLNTLTVDSGNTVFSDYKNVLYSSDKSSLVACPGGVKTVEVYPGCRNIQQYSMTDLELDKIVFTSVSNDFTLSMISMLGITVKEGITLPEGLTTVGAWSLSSITAPFITFPSTITNFYDEAVKKINVSRIDLSPCANLRSIPTGCFQSSFIRELILPSGITSLGYSAVYNCSLLRSIEIPFSVTSIGDSCFYNCSSLTNVTFYDQNLDSIGNSAFKACNITSVVLPKRIKVLGVEIFAQNPGMKSITFPSDSQLNTIQIGVLRDCDQIENIHFPSNLENFVGGALYGMGGLQNITVESSNNYFASDDGILYTKDHKELVAFPGGREKYIIHKDVEIFRESAFFMCKKLQVVTYECEVVLKIIKEQTFYECENFETIDIPMSVTDIKAQAFSGCTSLRNVKFEDKSQITTIVETTFDKCYSLQSVIFGDNSMLTEIQNNVFADLKNLSIFSAPPSLRKIGGRAFYGCTNLYSFSLFEIAEIGDEAFGNCARFTTVSLGPNLTSLGQWSFFGCNKLESVLYCGQASFPEVAFQNNT